MNAEDIRKTNELCQKQCMKTKTPGEQQAGMESLKCSMLTEVAAQLAEANEYLKRALYPPLMMGYDKTKIDPADWPELPQPVMTVTKPPFYQPRWVWFKYRAFKYVVDAREVASISVPDPTHCVIIMRNEGGPDPGRWCDGSYEEVCAKLGIPMEEK